MKTLCSPENKRLIYTFNRNKLISEVKDISNKNFFFFFFGVSSENHRTLVRTVTRHTKQNRKYRISYACGTHLMTSRTVFLFSKNQSWKLSC